MSADPSLLKVHFYDTIKQAFLEGVVLVVLFQLMTFEEPFDLKGG